MWGVCFEFTPVEQFRRAWSYLVQENSIPNAWERMPENAADWDKMDYGWENWYCSTDWANEISDPIIVVSPLDANHLPGETSLFEFAHPADCVYWFGSDKKDLWPVHLEGRDYSSIYIPDSGHMYSFSAAAMIIYDRRLKQWQS